MNSKHKHARHLTAVYPGKPWFASCPLNFLTWGFDANFYEPDGLPAGSYFLHYYYHY